MESISELLEIGTHATRGYFRYLAGDIANPSTGSYFYLLVVVSLFAAIAERLAPWRKKQPFRRKQWALDLFYMFFNFFGFWLVGFAALNAIAGALIRPYEPHALLDLSAIPAAGQVLLYLVVRDFLHYWIHRVLHKVPWMWKAHQIHHSVEEMGFAAHLRYHPLESVFYRVLEFLPMSLLGFGIDDFFFAHAIALLIGHLNHSNLRLPLGPLHRVLNSPQMHLLHHARTLPKERLERHGGVNFGLTFSLWDYLFGTAYMPEASFAGAHRDEKLGFPRVEEVPASFLGQLAYPFRKRSPASEKSVEV